MTETETERERTTPKIAADARNSKNIPHNLIMNSMHLREDDIMNRWKKNKLNS